MRLVEKARDKSLESLEDSFSQSESNINEETAKATAHVGILKGILRDLQHQHTSIQGRSRLGISSSSSPSDLGWSGEQTQASDVGKLLSLARHECRVLENPSFLVKRLIVSAGPIKTIETFEHHLQSLVLTTFKVEEAEVFADDAQTSITSGIASSAFGSETPANSNLTVSPEGCCNTGGSGGIWNPMSLSIVPKTAAMLHYRRQDRKFLVLSAASEKRASDVCVKIRGTVGRCIVDCMVNTAVSFDTLSAYDAVLVWVGGNLSFANSTGLGAHLSNYVRSGGGVVVCPWALSTDDCGYGLRGEIVDSGILGTHLGECLSGTQMMWPPNKSADYYQRLYRKYAAQKNNKGSYMFCYSAAPSRSTTASVDRTSLDGNPLTTSNSSINNTILSNVVVTPRCGSSCSHKRTKLRVSDDGVVEEEEGDVMGEEGDNVDNNNIDVDSTVTAASKRREAGEEDDENISFEAEAEEYDDYDEDEFGEESAHPIMKDVHIIDGGPYSGHHCIAVSESPEWIVERAASWEDGTPFVITTKALDGSRYMAAVVNLYPVSSDFSSRCWNVKTDFAVLLSNALHLVARK